MKKFFLFDSDQTIWTSDNHDYISSVVSPLILMSENSIARIVDGNVFFLKPEIREAFKLIKKSGSTTGIVSDNRKDMVINALKLFDIYKFLNLNAINVRLWKGYCPKHKMILEILDKPEFKNILSNNIYWFDDKNYSEEAAQIGVNFIRAYNDINLASAVKKLIYREN